MVHFFMRLSSPVLILFEPNCGMEIKSATR
jgi:hypothetical protein